MEILFSLAEISLYKCGHNLSELKDFLRNGINETFTIEEK